MVRQLAVAYAGSDGPVDIYNRPEEVLLGPPGHGSPRIASLTGRVTKLVLTRPLARVSVDCDRAVTALVLHRDLSALSLRPGVTVGAVVPDDGIRVFPAR